MVMAYDYKKVARLPVDPRIADKVSRTPMMAREQGNGFMAAYGGATRYAAVSKLNSDERVSFYAVQDGFDNAADIAAATGLTESEASKALSSLSTKGFVSVDQMAK